MYTFESLLPCRRVRLVDGELALEGVFTVWKRRADPFVILARVSGANAGETIGFEVKLVRLDGETDEVWTEALKVTPPRAGGRPVELAAMFRGGEHLSAGVYIATMVLDDGQQSSVTFDVQ